MGGRMAEPISRPPSLQEHFRMWRST